ncbi:MAG: hypothetical protein ACETWG_01950 [Candidatus Neomarinimicrobiota bacterium]
MTKDINFTIVQDYIAFANTITLVAINLDNPQFQGVSRMLKGGENAFSVVLFSGE